MIVHVYSNIGFDTLSYIIFNAYRYLRHTSIHTGIHIELEDGCTEYLFEHPSDNVDR